jgi:hypothetical protein
MDNEIFIENEKCPRCNEIHPNTLLKLKKPTRIFWAPQPIAFTYWGVCPITREPFLVPQLVSQLDLVEDYSI